MLPAYLTKNFANFILKISQKATPTAPQVGSQEFCCPAVAGAHHETTLWTTIPGFMF